MEKSYMRDTTPIEILKRKITIYDTDKNSKSYSVTETKLYFKVLFSSLP